MAKAESTSTPKKTAAPKKTVAKAEPEPKAPKKAAPKTTAVKLGEPVPLLDISEKKAPTTRKPKAAKTAEEPPRQESPVQVHVTAEERHTMVCNAAYYIAERRGFTGGDPFQDWLEAEREVDQLLGNR
jgi:hypothetical protein